MTTSTNIANTDQQRRLSLDKHRSHSHPGCVVCDPSNPYGLKLLCHPDGEGRVSARFQPQPRMVGFTGQLHGGIVSALLDGAMTQCMFACDEQAVTAVMHIRFRHPVPLNRELQVFAWIEQSDRPRHQLKAELHDDGRLLAEAEALFMSRPDDD